MNFRRDPGEGPIPIDRRLAAAYFEANDLEEAGLEALCPSYVELRDTRQNYQEETLIGTGSLKQVFRCWDFRARRWIALARLREDRGPEFYDLLVNEAWTTSSLKHPNIISIHDVGIDADGRPYFTMDLKGDTTLADLVRQCEGGGREHLLDTFLKVCDAVSYAHSRGILHLDLKPENIQAERFGEVLVCDWGLAKCVGDGEQAEEDFPFPDQSETVGNLTIFGEINGTLGYMAPEQVSPGALKDARTDVFALGCVLHFVLTGMPPVIGGTQREMLDRTARADFPPLRRVFPRRMIPETLEAIFFKACAPYPGGRYATVAELADDIRSFLGGYATRAEEPGFLKASLLFLRRHRLPTLIALGGIVALTVLSVLFVQRLSAQRKATATASERADRIAGELALQVESVGRSSKELSRRLAASANAIKNFGIFENPLESNAEAIRIARLAGDLDPASAEARFQLFSLYCLRLDFHSALKVAPPRNHKFGDYPQIAELFPDFDYDENKRPAPKLLAEFFRCAFVRNPGRVALMERILSYDAAARGGYSGPEPVVAFLDYVHRGPGHLTAAHDPEGTRLTLKTSGSFRLLLREHGSSGGCFLRFLPLRALTLDAGGEFNLSELNGLEIRNLDVRGCTRLSIKSPLELPQLEEIRVRPGQIDPALLLSRLRSSNPYRIVEEES